MTSISVKKPKHIIQVFHNHNIYGKAEHRAASRRQEISQWNSIIDSSTGYAEGETLILHESIKEQQNDFDNCDLLVLNDYNRESARPGWLTKVGYQRSQTVITRGTQGID